MPAKKGIAELIVKEKKRNIRASNALIARSVGCTRANVRSVLSTYLGNCTEQELQEFQENKADIFDAKAMQIVKSITPKKLTNSSGVQLATMLGIIYDKTALMRGQPTGIDVLALWDVAAAMRESKG